MTATTPINEKSRIEDALEYLPLARRTEYLAGQVIYSPEQPSNSIYLVVSGKVLISQFTAKGDEVLLDVVRTEDLFGESAFLETSRPSEKALAFEKSEIMMWPVTDLEDLVIKCPRLGVALLQMLARRNVEFTRRIESFATDTIELRLARSLLRFSERLGSRDENGTIRMMPFTHEMLSRYVGTSREIITQYMIRFRKQGYVEYSRSGIVLHAETLAAVLGESD